MDYVKVLVRAGDEFARAGVDAMLSGSEQVRLLPDDDSATPDVIVVAVDGAVERSFFALLRRYQRAIGTASTRVVLVADRFRAEDLLVAIECGVSALLPRSELKAGTLLSAVLTVSRGAALMPYRLQGILLDQIAQLRSQVLDPAGLTLCGFETRERDVLQLISEGMQTDEIAAKLTYSEGTVKNILYALMNRLRLKTRSHAVAYAMRAGVI